MVAGALVSASPRAASQHQSLGAGPANLKGLSTEEEFGSMTDLILSRQNSQLSRCCVCPQFRQGLGSSQLEQSCPVSQYPDGVISHCAPIFLESLGSPLEAGVSVILGFFIRHLMHLLQIF